MADWSYGGAYLRHDMDGIIELPNESKIKVHDLTHGLPDFMRMADVLFVDPPCSTGNLRSFHTKADQDLPYTFNLFEMELFKRIDEINPKHLFMEVFASNKGSFLDEIGKRYKHTKVYDSFYYNKPKNKCWIIHASNDLIGDLPIQEIDETKAIAWICKNMDFKCIGDLCMGRGTVGRYAYMNKRQFVGTELNKKRLALLVEHIEKNEQKLGKLPTNN
jgi:hypothetical protein